MRAAFFSIALTLAASPAMSQTVEEALRLSREKIAVQKRFIVSGSLPLTEPEEKAFWPLFEEYQEELTKIEARENRLISDYAAIYATLTDGRARDMLDELVRIEEDRVKLKKRWVERMASALPPRKLARFFQIENKLEAIVAHDLSQQIPLVP